jgi:predicted HTH transcriptional regulator
MKIYSKFIIELNKDVSVTVCAFLNRSGGEIFLGVKDNGDIFKMIFKVEGDATQQADKPKSPKQMYYTLTK